MNHVEEMKTRQNSRQAPRGREVLAFLKSRSPVYHDSNVFFRDIQYGIQAMLREKGSRVRYPEAERLAGDVIEDLERANVLVRLDRQTWRVNEPGYRTPPVKKPAPPGAAAAPAGKPATPAQAVPRPAGQAAAAPGGEARTS